MNPLDNPAWASLCGAHRAFSRGNDKARCYAADINLFGATVDDSPEALEALAALVGENASVCILQARQVTVPPGLRMARRHSCVQLVLHDPLRIESVTHRIKPVVLGEDDADDMLALATLARPGPFMRRTHCMGRFVGVRIDGRLVAMAGERFRFPGHTEVSGVCTHPEYRGQGFAAALSQHVAARILARGELPFLQSWSDNAQAIRLYERLGFRIRGEINVAVLQHDK